MKNYLTKNPPYKADSLVNLIKTDFVVIEGCYFLTFFSEVTRYSTGLFIDRTSCECTANGFRADDYIQSEHLNACITFINHVIVDWTKKDPSLKIEGIISQHKRQKHTNVKIHIKRLDEAYLHHNLNDFKEERLLILSNSQEQYYEYC